MHIYLSSEVIKEEIYLLTKEVQHLVLYYENRNNIIMESLDCPSLDQFDRGMKALLYQSVGRRSM